MVSTKEEGEMKVLKLLVIAIFAAALIAAITVPTGTAQSQTSPLQPAEDTSLGRGVSLFDPVADTEDTGGPLGFGEDVEAFTRFMRSTKAPPRDRALVPDDATDPGSQLFDQLNCSVCHTRSITTTANAGTTFNGGTFTVGLALANKTYHPFGDFLLHDIGTGDGIVETNGETTRNKVRTAPLWGLAHQGSADARRGF
jgi:CxxC motif-containing protein (DUF1111 family)